MNGADGDPLQIDNTVTQKLCGAANLAIFALAHDQLQHGVIWLCFGDADLHGLGGHPIEADPAGPLIQDPLAWSALDADPVRLPVGEARVGQLQGEGPVVAEQKGPSAFKVQAPHWVKSLASG